MQPQDDELQDQIATQKLLARSRELGDNAPADNGVIEKITCVNFMCHDNLEVELGPLLNFIVGMNGSGKSAVLTAITLSLGGKASSTSRGTSIKSFIKEGRDQALLIIKLKNQGVDAYQPDLFGPSIIIERHFSKNGSGGFRLRNSTGRGIISTKKGDVDDIVEYFCLQTDNPITILSQDAAKSFLNSSSPKMKYDFFYAGTQLAQLDNDYRLVHDTCDRIEHLLDDSKDDLISLKAKKDDAASKKKLVDQREPMRLAAKDLRRKVAWVQVEEEERKLADRRRTVADIEEEIRCKNVEVERRDEDVQKLDELMARSDEEVQALSDELQLLQQEEQPAKDTAEAKAKADREAHVQCTELTEELSAAQSVQNKVEEAVSNEKTRLELIDGGAHTHILVEMEEAKVLQTGLQESLTENVAKTAGLQVELRNARRNEDEVKTMLESKQIEIRECGQRISSIHRPDPMSPYGPNLPALLRDIASGSFQDKVIGPIGLNIRLTEPRWSSILEKFFGNLLNGFIVGGKEDQVHLSQLMQRRSLNYPVYIFSGERNTAFDTKDKEPTVGFPTILSVLEIDNMVVKNQLIISHAIEQILLIEKKENADKVMFSGSPPLHVKACYRLNPNRRGWGVRLTLTGRDRNPAEDYVEPWKGPTRMLTEVEDQKSFLENTLAQLENDKVAIENRYRLVRQGVSKAEVAVKANADASRNLKVEIQRSEERSSHLQAEYDKYNIEDGHLEALLEDLQRAKEDMDRLGGIYGKAVLHKKEMNIESLSAKRALKSVRDKISSHNVKIDEATAKAKRFSDARKNAQLEKNTALNGVADLEEMHQRASSKVGAQQAQVATITEQATASYPHRVPIEEGETFSTLSTKYDNIHKALENYRRRQGGTDQDIIDQCANATAAYEIEKKRRDSMEELHGILKRSFQQRMVQFRKFRRLIGARSRINFSYLLSERAFRGALVIDHKRKLLHVDIEPDETVMQGTKVQGHAPKGLSGGEKSYSSVSKSIVLGQS